MTTCCLARDALNMLRERKDGFDIVISDVNMPDMDGFKLLEHVGLEMDLPVISESTVYFFLCSLPLTFFLVSNKKCPVKPHSDVCRWGNK